MKTVNISAHIDEKLAQKLELVSQFEERAKSYYIKKGLTDLLEEKAQDIEDYITAQKTLQESIDNGEEIVSFEEVFKNVE